MKLYSIGFTVDSLPDGVTHSIDASVHKTRGREGIPVTALVLNNSTSVDQLTVEMNIPDSPSAVFSSFFSKASNQVFPYTMATIRTNTSSDITINHVHSNMLEVKEGATVLQNVFITTGNTNEISSGGIGGSNYVVGESYHVTSATGNGLWIVPSSVSPTGGILTYDVESQGKGYVQGELVVVQTADSGYGDGLASFTLSADVSVPHLSAGGWKGIRIGVDLAGTVTVEIENIPSILNCSFTSTTISTLLLHSPIGEYCSIDDIVVTHNITKNTSPLADNSLPSFMCSHVAAASDSAAVGYQSQWEVPVFEATAASLSSASISLYPQYNILADILLPSGDFATVISNSIRVGSLTSEGAYSQKKYYTYVGVSFKKAVYIVEKDVMLVVYLPTGSSTLMIGSVDLITGVLSEGVAKFPGSTGEYTETGGILQIPTPTTAYAVQYIPLLSAVLISTNRGAYLYGILNEVVAPLSKLSPSSNINAMAVCSLTNTLWYTNAVKEVYTLELDNLYQDPVLITTLLSASSMIIENTFNNKMYFFSTSSVTWIDVTSPTSTGVLTPVTANFQGVPYFHEDSGSVCVGSSNGYLSIIGVANTIQELHTLNDLHWITATYIFPFPSTNVFRELIIYTATATTGTIQSMAVLTKVPIAGSGIASSLQSSRGGSVSSGSVNNASQDILYLEQKTHPYTGVSSITQEVKGIRGTADLNVGWIDAGATSAIGDDTPRLAVNKVTGTLPSITTTGTSQIFSSTVLYKETNTDSPTTNTPLSSLDIDNLAIKLVIP